MMGRFLRSPSQSRTVPDLAVPISPRPARIYWLMSPALIAVLALTVLIYWPGLSGPLLLDDVVNLQALGEGGGVNDWNSLLRYVFGNGSGVLGRPVSMLSFLLDAQDWPPRVFALKYTNLMIHLLCGLLLGWLFWLWGRVRNLEAVSCSLLALCGLSLWLLHPMNVSTTLYVIQRMTQLMTLFALVAMLLFCQGRVALQQGQSRGFVYLLLCLFPFGLLSLLSKENGVLLLLGIVITEQTLFQDWPRQRQFTWWYRCAVLLPLVLAAAYFVWTFASRYEDFSFRPFGPVERLLTECRILLLYLWGILFPPSTDFGLVHDDIRLSTGMFQPLTTLPSLLLIIGVNLLAWWQRRKQPVLALGVFWFFGMHLLESTILPLELYFEHRNYLAMAGPLFALLWYLRVGLLALRQPAVAAFLSLAFFALMLGLITMTRQQTVLWGNTPALFAAWAEQHPDSVRAQAGYADYLITVGQLDPAIDALKQANQAHPEELSVLLYLWNLHCSQKTVAPYSIATIAGRDVLENYVGNLNLHLRVLLEHLVNEDCTAPAENEIVALFERAVAMPQSSLRRSNLHVLYSEYFVSRRNLDGALIQLREAFELRPLADFPLRQAVLSASAGRYADSLVFLDRARAADARRPALQPSQSAEIEQMYAQIISLSGSAPTNQ